MIELLDESTVPEWLAGLTADRLDREPLPLEGILKDSLYYPCCAFDGRPVRYLARYIHSFVYVDYGTTRRDLIGRIESDEDGFRGYDVLGWRDVSARELTPHGWRPVVVPGGHQAPAGPISGEDPFCVWAVFRRSEAFDEGHGPERFSLLYLCADGAAAYQALFGRFTPRAIAIIQPGTGFGGNYDDYLDPNGVFARSVRATGRALPAFLLNGGIGGREHYREPVWPRQYDVDLGWLSDQAIHVWGLSE